MAREKSILSDENEPQCFICNTTMMLEVHHIYNGPYRSKSDKDGCWCYLCAYHHRESNNAIHRNPERARWLKAYTQRKWEQRYIESKPAIPKADARQAFMRMYGKSYI